MPIYAYEYVYDPANTERMNELRPFHRGYLGKGADEGRVLASGPYPNDNGALILINADNADTAAEFMDSDPFWKNGLVSKRIIREWKSVLGAFTDL